MGTLGSCTLELSRTVLLDRFGRGGGHNRDARLPRFADARLRDSRDLFGGERGFAAFEPCDRVGRASVRCRVDGTVRHLGSCPGR